VPELADVRLDFRGLVAVGTPPHRTLFAEAASRLPRPRIFSPLSPDLVEESPYSWPELYRPLSTNVRFLVGR
jgi:hypothetical protein